MKIYLISSFLNKKVAAMAMDQIKEAGHVITVDWTKHEFTNELGVLGKESVEDYEGIIAADVVVFLWPGRLSSMSELGIAVATSKRVIMVGNPPMHENLYFNYPTIIHVADMDEAIKELEDIQRHMYEV